MEDIFTINGKIKDAIVELSNKHRLIFWYDNNADMKTIFESLDFSDIQKLVIENNEFGIKCKVLNVLPKQKFLIYQSSPKPKDTENWLLDLNLSNVEFYTDSASIILQGLKLSQEHKPFIQQHIEFFSDEKRVIELKELLDSDENVDKIKLKMLAILCKCIPEWDNILFSLFEDELTLRKNKYNTITNLSLDEFFWDSIEKNYGYVSQTKSIKDFLILLFDEIFKSSIQKETTKLNRNIFLFVNRWKDNVSALKTYEEWSKLIESELDIETQLHNENVDLLIENDTFSSIDRKIILETRDHIIRETLSDDKIQEWIEKRRVKFFFKGFSSIYEALSHASGLLNEIKRLKVDFETASVGFETYAKSYYKIDRLYRKYIYYSENAEHSDLLKSLTIKIEKAYENSYLILLSESWQKIVDKMSDWEINNITCQRNFYREWVEPYIKTNNRIFVIISDALRYESASELRDLVLSEDRYTAQLKYMLGSLPSYTQLGMASLLPNTELTFQDRNDIVYSSGISTQGTINRTKVLQKNYTASIAINAEDFLKMNAKTEGRAFVKEYNVIYIFSNNIDKTGDNKDSESNVFEATEKEFAFLIKILKQINNMNGYNMIITSDHGYIYQHNKIKEMDFLDYSVNGEVFKSSRRFIIGKNLLDNSYVKKFTGKEVGFADETEILIPKSINRFRLQGSGSRFVHGGASLQEIVVPVLEINKARRSDLEKVDIDVFSSVTNITSNSFGVSFYQRQPIEEKRFPRQIKAGFYTASGKLISDTQNILFNSVEKEAADREQRKGFAFTSDAVSYNGQDVYLKLEEQIEGTSQFKPYKSVTFRMLIAFTSEFDEF